MQDGNLMNADRDQDVGVAEVQTVGAERKEGIRVQGKDKFLAHDE